MSLQIKELEHSRISVTDDLKNSTKRCLKNPKMKNELTRRGLLKPKPFKIYIYKFIISLYRIGLKRNVNNRISNDCQ